MEQFILFAVLGIGGGAAYALTALGIVLIYKGSGVVNFGQGAVAMFAAFCYAVLARAGVPNLAAAGITVAGAAVGGVALYALVVRPLRNASGLAQTVVTLGILVTLNATAVLLWNDDVIRGITAPALLPTSTVQMFGTALRVDRLWLLGITVGLVPVLSLLYRRTTFGLATRAVAESERGAALRGFSPDRVAAGNWAIGCALAGVAGILIAPISSLDINVLSLIVLPALAAALCGRFTLFAATAAAGIAIGVGQSLVTRYSTVQGMGSVIPVAVVILAIVLTGKRIPQRGTTVTGRPPLATGGQVRPFWVVAFPLVVLLGLFLTDNRHISAITTSLTAVIFALSLVVITGFVGQINLAPLSFAAVGAFATSFLAHNAGIPFPLPLILAGLVAVPIGLLIGLPALRIRGINLAVVTLGVGLVMDNAVFQSYWMSGGQTGRPVPSAEIFGVSLDAGSHPAAFGVFVLVVVAVLALMVSSIRRSGLGRRMLAVRGNERAAAAAGINVATVKLVAFAISAFIAGVGGAVLGYRFNATSSGNFTLSLSLTVVSLAFIGGIGSVSGAFQAGLITTGGILFVLVNRIGGISRYWDLITGVLLVLTVVTQPDGIVVQNMRFKAALAGRLRRGRPLLATPDEQYA